MKEKQGLDSVVVRFAGDSGDGIQVMGSQFTLSNVLEGTDISTLPDFPAEIRAPQGTLSGVSGFQAHFGSGDILTPGDRPDVLVVMNPAALKVNLGDMEPKSLIIVNTDKFNAGGLKKAGYDHNPLEDEAFLRNYRVVKIDMTASVKEALKDSALSENQKVLCKNFFALGIILWLYDRSLDSVSRWLEKKFKLRKPDVYEANITVLKAGYYFGETTEMFISQYRVKPQKFQPGDYRKVSGNEAICLGLATIPELSGVDVVFGGYPITPASDIIVGLQSVLPFGVKTTQVEDEIAGIGVAIGASYAGALGVTATSGPGIALQLESMGLAVMVELPLVIINVQRGGPSTGLPTKTEQGDLLQAVYGRHGESPMPVLAPSTPKDCFDIMIEASRIALEFNVPVLVLSEAYLANGTEPWAVPSVKSLTKIKPCRVDETLENYVPYGRSSVSGARQLAIPGTKGFEHRVGGLEKNDEGAVSYDPDNHERMTHLREEKCQKIAKTYPKTEIEGALEGDVLVVGWGGTYGAIACAVRSINQKEKRVGYVHLRHVYPLPLDLEDILKRFKHVIVPELNRGQLIKILRATYLVDAKPLSKVQGKPLTVREVEDEIEKYLRRSF